MSKFIKSLLFSFFLLFSLSLKASQREVLTTLDQHTDILKMALNTADKKITIVSPFISHVAIGVDNLCQHIENAISRGVIVEVITDHKLDRDSTGKLRQRSARGRGLLREAGVHLKVAYKVHSKIIIVDDVALVVGSFNWLSAVRSPSSIYSNQETSILLFGANVEKNIEEAQAALDSLKLVEEGDRSFFKTLEIAIRGNTSAYLAICKKYKDNSRYKLLISQSLSYFMKDESQIAEIAIGLRDSLGLDILPQIFEYYNGEFSSFYDLLQFARHMKKVDIERVDEFLEDNVDGLVEAGQNMSDELIELYEMSLMETWSTVSNLSQGIHNGVIFDRLK
mgnify:CR=1 FL=1